MSVSEYKAQHTSSPEREKTPASQAGEVYLLLVQTLALPLVLASFLSQETGHDYGIGLIQKLWLLLKTYRNHRRIPGATSWYEHLIMIEAILKLPPSTPGVVVECGCYKGASTANLSLACQLTQRKLIVFDSFSGLPVPKSSDREHHCPTLGEIHTYTKGSFKGRLKEVRQNLSRFGHLPSCQLVPGYFAKTLPKFHQSRQKAVFVFTDVDLTDSLKTCLKYIWPNLHSLGVWFTHEAQHLEISQLFFDRPWWRRELKQKPPGLIGAGVGLPVGLKSTALGYTP
ncbi:MAG: class I SAM-dependent methyltransferase [Candidatus Chisholmbacteria bacterium]|nr:class I SAM-dependent methyltransferase [Candidatus Chisholmbacteria bacterium]